MEKGSRWNTIVSDVAMMDFANAYNSIVISFQLSMHCGPFSYIQKCLDSKTRYSQMSR
jgi:hypothetical protein